MTCILVQITQALTVITDYSQFLVLKSMHLNQKGIISKSHFNIERIQDFLLLILNSELITELNSD